ncbi:hypothetical protein [Nonomuraea basaltis]|uniref:hypothetical protein n=1 Tax=Nonomuraea basaltis TaxID=2495887 RepID=UPI00110C647F|nr:hypothetical protein [Nonomuraea basaltis]TMR92576.1 hypothetical protein EJK15_44040 [Nonomuraea basaltis]
MLGLFPLKKAPAPDRLLWMPSAPRTIRWHVMTRRYSPKSRRNFRRILLAAEARNVRVTVQHDHGMLFRLHLLKLTGTPAALDALDALFNHLADVRPAVTPWWIR